MTHLINLLKKFSEAVVEEQILESSFFFSTKVDSPHVERKNYFFSTRVLSESEKNNFFANLNALNYKDLQKIKTFELEGKKFVIYCTEGVTLITQGNGARFIKAFFKKGV